MMRRLGRWATTSPRRLALSVTAALLGAALVMGVVVTVRVQGLQEQLAAAAVAREAAEAPSGPVASSLASQDGLEVWEGGQPPVGGAAAPVAPAPFVPAVTSPEGVAVAAVDAWAAGDVELAGNAMPALVDVLPPVPDGTMQAGAPVLVGVDSTRARVQVPTTTGPVLVVLLDVGGTWRVDDLAPA